MAAIEFSKFEDIWFDLFERTCSISTRRATLLRCARLTEDCRNGLQQQRRLINFQGSESHAFESY